MNMDAPHYLRTAEAALSLAAARARIALLPVAPLRAADILRDDTPRTSSLAPTSDPRARAVARAVWAAARRVPWEAHCLDHALAARAMLRRRRIPASLMLGVTREAGEVKAHAWLVAGGAAVVGGSEAAKYHALDAAGKP